MQRRPRERAFTLIELMLAVTIAVVIFWVAVPSMKGLSAERRLVETFDRFDEFTRKAQIKAISSQRPWVLVWETGVISLEPADPTAEETSGPGGETVESFTYGEDESFTLQRPTSLLAPDQTPARWTFWRSGACEPVLVDYSGPGGTWTARYNPLTGRGDITDQTIQ